MAKKYEIKAAQFYARNPQVYQQFCHYAAQLWNTGRRKIASRMIWDRMRWDHAISTVNDGFKLNNNYEFYFARKYLDEHPDRADFFTQRTARQDELAAQEAA